MHYSCGRALLVLRHYGVNVHGSQHVVIVIDMIVAAGAGAGVGLAVTIACSCAFAWRHWPCHRWSAWGWLPGLLLLLGTGCRLQA